MHVVNAKNTFICLEVFAGKQFVIIFIFQVFFNYITIWVKNTIVKQHIVLKKGSTERSFCLQNKYFNVIFLRRKVYQFNYKSEKVILKICFQHSGTLV